MYLARLGVLALTYEYSYSWTCNNSDIISFVENIILHTYSYILMHLIHVNSIRNIDLVYECMRFVKFQFVLCWLKKQNTL